MNGLLGGQAQGQQQANLLGGVFQNPSSIRRQERNSLLGNAIEISQLRDPFSASIAMGATQAGLGIGRALGFETQGDRTSRIVSQVQEETVQSGLDPLTNPEETFKFISNRFNELGAPDLAAQALVQAQPFIDRQREQIIQNEELYLKRLAEQRRLEEAARKQSELDVRQSQEQRLQSQASLEQATEEEKRSVNASARDIIRSPINPELSIQEQIDQVSQRVTRLNELPLETEFVSSQRTRLQNKLDELSELRREEVGAAQTAQAQREAAAEGTYPALTALQDARTIVDSSTFPTTGQVGEALAGVPFFGQGSTDLRNTLQTIKANIAFGALQEMRNNSPTGGALGQVSNVEIGLLQSTAATVEQSSSKGQFLYNLAKLENQFLDTIHGKGNGPERNDLEALREIYLAGNVPETNEQQPEQESPQGQTSFTELNQRAQQ